MVPLAFERPKHLGALADVVLLGIASAIPGGQWWTTTAAWCRRASERTDGQRRAPRGANVTDGIGVRRGVTRQQCDGSAGRLRRTDREYGRALVGGQHAPGLEHHRRGARDVPERHAIVEYEVEAAERAISEWQRRRPEAPDAVAAQPALHVLRHAALARRANREERVRREWLAAHAQRPVVQPGAAARAAREGPAFDGLVNGP